MDIALFKIRRAGLPDLGLGVKCLNSKPSGIADAAAVLARRGEKDLKIVVTCPFVDLKYQSADLFALANYAVCFVFGVIKATLNGGARNYLAVILKVVVSHSEFLERTEFERLLIVENELLAIVCQNGRKRDICVLFHKDLLFFA